MDATGDSIMDPARLLGRSSQPGTGAQGSDAPGSYPQGSDAPGSYPQGSDAPGSYPQGSQAGLLERLEWHIRGPVAWRATPAGAVQHLTARLDGIPVVGLEVKIHRDQQGHPCWAVLPAGLIGAAVPESGFAFHDPLSPGSAGSDDRPWPCSAANRRWLWKNESLQPIHWIERNAHTPEGEVIVLDARSGEVLERRSAVQHLAGATGRGLVFDPNPIVASGGLPLDADDDIDPFRDWVTLRGLDGSGLLRGRWVDVESPAGRAFAVDHEHIYSARNLHFEEVMAYYHITTALDWIETLGFAHPLPAAQRVIVHATGLDASWYAIATRTIHLGDGGQEDGEDADIILHELGHAVFHAQVGDWGGGDSNALSEGWADYLAASRTDGSRIGDWDGAGRPDGCLRDIAPRRRYPFDCTGDLYEDGLVYSSLLWHLRETLGAPLADQLAMQSLLMLAPSATLPDAAAALAYASRMLAGALGNDGVIPIVEEALVKWGFAPRRVELSLNPRDQHPDAWLALDFTFVPPGSTVPLLCDSLRIRADGAIEFAGATQNGTASTHPVVAPVRALPEQAAQPIHDHIVVSQEASLWDCRVDLRFIADHTTVRHAQLTLAADGTLEVAWFGEGDLRAFPALSGYYPSGTTTGAVRFDPREENELVLGAGSGVHFTPVGQSAHTLAGARIRCQPAGRDGYRLSVSSPPLPTMDTPEPQLSVFPTPAGRDGRVRFRIATEGRYELQLLSPSGRVVAREDLGRLEPGLHPAALTSLTSTSADLTSGVFYLRLTGSGEPVVTRVLICK